MFAPAPDTDYSNVADPTARYVLPNALRASCRWAKPRGDNTRAGRGGGTPNNDYAKVGTGLGADPRTL